MHFLCTPDLQPLAAPGMRLSPDGAPSDGTRGEAPVRILMAEDNPINQRVGKLILQRAGFNIDLVADGNEAVEAHRANPYDLILMDCQMPTMDGFEASRTIRQLNQRQPVIIAVTANALVGEREKCLDAGMNDYLSKPFQADQLVSLVKKWCATLGNS
jgi:two-component system, sensor histidine kinase and response regulator